MYMIPVKLYKLFHILPFNIRIFFYSLSLLRTRQMLRGQFLNGLFDGKRFPVLPSLSREDWICEMTSETKFPIKGQVKSHHRTSHHPFISNKNLLLSVFFNYYQQYIRSLLKIKSFLIFFTFTRPTPTPPLLFMLCLYSKEF